MVMIIGAGHLQPVLASYAAYYNQTRTHLALQKDARFRREIQRSGRIIAIPILAGLHHQYVWISLSDGTVFGLELPGAPRRGRSARIALNVPPTYDAT
jgi:hypothetical protein